MLTSWTVEQFTILNTEKMTADMASTMNGSNGFKGQAYQPQEDVYVSLQNFNCNAGNSVPHTLS